MSKKKIIDFKVGTTYIWPKSLRYNPLPYPFSFILGGGVRVKADAISDYLNITERIVGLEYYTSLF